MSRDFLVVRTSHTPCLTAIAQEYNGGPVGIEALAATINEEPGNLIDVVEPLLLKIGFVARTPGGRNITEAGPGAPGRQGGHLPRLL